MIRHYPYIVNYLFDEQTGLAFSDEVIFAALTGDHSSSQMAWLSDLLGGVICSPEKPGSQFARKPVRAVLDALVEPNADDLEYYHVLVQRLGLPYIDLAFVCDEAGDQHYIVCPEYWNVLPLGTQVRVDQNWFVLVRQGEAFITLVPVDCLDLSAFEKPALPDWATKTPDRYR